MLDENFFPFILRKKRNSSRQTKANKLRVYFPVARNYLCNVGLFIYVRVHIVVEHVPQAQHSTAQNSTARHSAAQHSAAQHSTAQHSTAQHSTAQHSTARRNQPSQAANHVRADQSATTQSDRVGESKHVLEHLQPAAFSKQTETSKSVRPTKNTTTHKAA